MIKAIVFDLDNTLIFRQEAAYNLITKFVNKYYANYSDLKKEGICQFVLTCDMYGAVDKRIMFELLLNKYPIEASIDSLYNEWRKSFGYEAVLNDMSIPTLKYLKNKGYLLGLITNGKEYMQKQKLEKTHLNSDYFDVITISDSEGCSKPDKKIFDITCDKLGVEISEVVFVGDTFDTDIVGAIEAGMQAVWIWPDDGRLSKYEVIRIFRIEELTSIF